MGTKRIFVMLPLVCLLSALADGQAVYSVTDLGPLSPTAINSWAQVVGTSNNHAFLWTKRDGLKDLGILPGGTFSSAAAINDFGIVAGTADGPGTVVSILPNLPNLQCSDLIQPFIWTASNGMRGLGSIATGGDADDPIQWCADSFLGTSINDRGQVAGFDGGYGTDQFGFRWTKAAGMDFFGGSWPPTNVNAVSNRGEIVGQNSTDLTLFHGHATFWKDGVTTDLGSLGGGPDVVDFASAANGVNDRGQIVGWSSTLSFSFLCYFGVEDGCTAHATLWSSSGTIVDLGTLPGDSFSVASKINFFGQVIGSSAGTAEFNLFSPSQVTGRPFVWSQRSGMRDLNTLIPANSGWVLNTATGINFWGQIVGSGTRNGQSHGFLLTPRSPFQLF